MTDFCRWTEPFFQNHHVLYLPNNYRTVKLAYNHSISHKTVHIICSAEPEPADLQWSGQKIRLDFNLLMCYDITSLSILYNLVCMGIHI